MPQANQNRRIICKQCCHALTNICEQELSPHIMPRGRAGGRRGAHESALQMKTIVICMMLFYREIFEEIERKIGMKDATARGIWQRAHDLADSDDLVDLLSVLEHKTGAGRPKKSQTVHKNQLQFVIYSTKNAIKHSNRSQTTTTSL